MTDRRPALVPLYAGAGSGRIHDLGLGDRHLRNLFRVEIAAEGLVVLLLLDDRELERGAELPGLELRNEPLVVVGVQQVDLVVGRGVQRADRPQDGGSKRGRARGGETRMFFVDSLIVFSNADAEKRSMKWPSTTERISVHSPGAAKRPVSVGISFSARRTLRWPVSARIRFSSGLSIASLFGYWHASPEPLPFIIGAPGSRSCTESIPPCLSASSRPRSPRRSRSAGRSRRRSASGSKSPPASAPRPAP